MSALRFFFKRCPNAAISPHIALKRGELLTTGFVKDLRQPADKTCKEKLMTMVAESKGQQKQRRSERTIPFVSGEEMVLISIGCQRSIIAKMLDLSEDGTLVYLSQESDILDAMDTQCTLTLYHREQLFDVKSKIARRSRRLIAFEFINPPSTVANRIRAKIIQMPDWMRVKGQKPR